MSQTIRVVFDGHVLCPLEPLDLQRWRSYLVTIEDRPDQEQSKHEPGILDDLLEIAIDTGVEDLAERAGHYRYDIPER
jgi:hypothetical protein